MFKKYSIPSFLFLVFIAFYLLHLGLFNHIAASSTVTDDYKFGHA